MEENSLIEQYEAGDRHDFCLQLFGEYLVLRTAVAQSV
jgi:hypothetical protein